LSFKCGNCDVPQDHGVKPIRRVTQIRHKDYVGGGQGWEVAKETLVCEPCKDKVQDVSPKKETA
jgi:hypothetical protein